MYWFAYAAPEEQLRRKHKARAATIHDSLHMLRDGQAFVELQAALSDRYELRDTLLNFPADAYDQPAPVPEQLDPGALVVLANRPPLDEEGRRTIDRSHTWLENEIFDALRSVFAHCSRKHIDLAEAFTRDRDPTQVLDRVYRSYGNAAPTAYLVHLPGALSFASLLCAFAVDGTKNLVWAHLLRTRQRELLASVLDSTTAHLVVAEMHGIAQGPQLPASLGAYCEQVTVALTLNRAL
jgi:hypothetical protein